MTDRDEIVITSIGPDGLITQSRQPVWRPHSVHPHTLAAMFGATMKSDQAEALIPEDRQPKPITRKPAPRQTPRKATRSPRKGR